MAEKRLLMLVAMEMIVRVNVEKLQVKCMQLNLALVLGGCQLLQQQWKQTEGESFSQPQYLRSSLHHFHIHYVSPLPLAVRIYRPVTL